jgi:uncharacterized membrane protein (UPF0127 family)
VTRLVHRPAAGEERVVAEDVRVADSFLARARGLMFRRSFRGDCLAFPFGDSVTRSLHMLFVPFDIDAVWVESEEVRAVERLPAWTGVGRARGDTVYELPAGAAAAVDPGDRLSLE